jgi:hypothetical protein
MNVLFFFVIGIGGAALFAGFVAMSLRGAPRQAPDTSAVSAVRQMVTLEGSNFANPSRLLDDTEYQILLSNPDLRQVARRFREERRDLAILWVSSLLVDLKRLWRFRRFLIRRGAHASLGEELKILQTFVISLAFLSFVRVSIRILGPFVFARTTRRARRAVETMSYSTAGLLGHIPSARWPEIQRSWAQSAA